MQYNRFIKTLEHNQTSHIKVISFSKSCNPSSIPNVFGLLLPNIIEQLEKSINTLCNNDQVILLFGLQTVSVTFSSDCPRLLNRVINNHNPSAHLCCSLAYLVVPNNQVTNIKSWEGAKNIVIDFTTGTIMDAQHYLSMVLEQPISGVIYGVLDSAKLRNVWSIINRHKKTNDMEITTHAA